MSSTCSESGVMSEIASKVREWIHPHKKRMYTFDEGTCETRNLLGIKGVNLCELYQWGLPVPRGFIVTTETCAEYWKGRDAQSGKEFKMFAELNTIFNKEVNQEIARNVSVLESNDSRGKRFGICGVSNDSSGFSKHNSADAPSLMPLLLSVRLSATVPVHTTLPCTVLNIGMNEANVAQMLQVFPSHYQRWIYDTYSRFLRHFGTRVLGMDRQLYSNAEQTVLSIRGVPDSSLLRVDELMLVVQKYQDIVKIPSDPMKQLQMAVRNIFNAWMSSASSHNMTTLDGQKATGAAAVIQVMVYGNRTNVIGSGTGILYTRNPFSGEKIISGQFLPNAEEVEDIIISNDCKFNKARQQSGTPSQDPYLPSPLQWVHQAFPIAQMNVQYNMELSILEEYASLLESRYREVQQIDFTIENHHLSILRSRPCSTSSTVPRRWSQSRSGLTHNHQNDQPSAAVQVRWAVDMANERLITEKEALLRVDVVRCMSYFMHDHLTIKDVQNRARKISVSVTSLLGVGTVCSNNISTSGGCVVGSAKFLSGGTADSDKNDEDTPAVMQDPESNVILCIKMLDSTSPQDLLAALRNKNVVGVIVTDVPENIHSCGILSNINKPVIQYRGWGNSISASPTKRDQARRQSVSHTPAAIDSAGIEGNLYSPPPIQGIFDINARESKMTVYCSAAQQSLPDTTTTRRSTSVDSSSPRNHRRRSRSSGGLVSGNNAVAEVTIHTTDIMPNHITTPTVDTAADSTSSSSSTSDGNGEADVDGATVSEVSVEHRPIMPCRNSNELTHAIKLQNNKLSSRFSSSFGGRSSSSSDNGKSRGSLIKPTTPPIKPADITHAVEGYWSQPVITATAASTGRAPRSSIATLSSRSAVIREGQLLALDCNTGAMYFGGECFSSSLIHRRDKEQGRDYTYHLLMRWASKFTRTQIYVHISTATASATSSSADSGGANDEDDDKRAAKSDLTRADTIGSDVQWGIMYDIKPYLISNLGTNDNDSGDVNNRSVLRRTIQLLILILKANAEEVCSKEAKANNTKISCQSSQHHQDRLELQLQSACRENFLAILFGGGGPTEKVGVPPVTRPVVIKLAHVRTMDAFPILNDSINWQAFVSELSTAFELDGMTKDVVAAYICSMQQQQHDAESTVKHAMMTTIISLQVRAVIEACKLARHVGIFVRLQFLIPSVTCEHELSQIISCIRKLLDDNFTNGHSTHCSINFPDDTQFSGGGGGGGGGGTSGNDLKKDVECIWGDAMTSLCTIGCMLEVPAACARADIIARTAGLDFIGIDSTALTKHLFGISEESSSTTSQQQWQQHHHENPFVSIDMTVVAPLLALTVDKIRSVRSDIPVGIHGEHSADLQSMLFFHSLRGRRHNNSNSNSKEQQVTPLMSVRRNPNEELSWEDTRAAFEDGIDYVSCSSVSLLPATALAAAQAEIHHDRKVRRYLAEHWGRMSYPRYPIADPRPRFMLPIL